MIDKLYGPPPGKKPAVPPSGPGSVNVPIRPTAGTSVENKLTVILPPGQVDFLDRLALDIRGKTGKKIKRTEIIRAIIAGVIASGLDLSTLGTEDDIAAAVRDRLKG